MTTVAVSVAPRPGSPRRTPVASNAVVGMAIFIAAEVMFFAALAAAFTITRISAGGTWPPPGQPRLPVEATAANTAVLLASGIAMVIAGRRSAVHAARSTSALGLALALGAAFVALQGYEWVGLLREGLTMRSGPHGSFFYLIVGAHALHAVAGIIALAVAFARARSGRLAQTYLAGARLYWCFVVLLWPALYWRVYL